MPEYVTPDILLNRSTEDNFKKMADIIPQDIDLSAGNHAWNMTRPTALAMAEMCEAILPRVIQVIIPEWSYGEFLDGHARTRALTRRAATAATGEITITGTAGTVIPTGSLFSTAAVGDEPSVDYATAVSATIPAEGNVTIPVQCTQTGIEGNTPAGTIVLVSSKLKNINSVTNAEAVTGGTERESDEDFQARICEYDADQGNSYTGSVADYKRWATSVPGVGEATIIPAQDDSGLVRIILTDSNGAPATTNLCQAVYNFIMKPDTPDKRLTPVGASIEVSPPATITLSVKATVELTEGATLEAVKAAYLAALTAYLPVAFGDGEIKYTRVAAALASVAGANDYADLQIGIKSGGSVSYDLVLTAGTV